MIKHNFIYSTMATIRYRFFSPRRVLTCPVLLDRQFNGLLPLLLRHGDVAHPLSSCHSLSLSTHQPQPLYQHKSHSLTGDVWQGGEMHYGYNSLRLNTRQSQNGPRTRDVAKVNCYPRAVFCCDVGKSDNWKWKGIGWVRRTEEEI